MKRLSDLFGSKEPKEPKEPKKPEIRTIGDLRSGKRVLYFDEFMDKEMKYRIKHNVRPLEWMDKVDIFESWYIPDRQSKGWVMIDPMRKKDRFYCEWQYGDEVIIGEYMDEKFTVSERLKKKKTSKF